MSFIPNNIQNNFFQKPISINDFVVENDKIGKGATGNVFKAIYIKTGKVFAIKKLKQTDFTSNDKEIDYYREKQILYDLTNKNYNHVVKLYADFQDANYRYLVMEFVDGITLKNLRGNNEKGYLDQNLVINILMQLLETLVYLHDKCNIMHRDIKPDNIILERNGNIKLLDFGLSAYLKNQNLQLVSQRSFKGAIRFVPVEILYAPPPLVYDYKIDVFSLGFTIYSLMNPSQGDNYNLPQRTVIKTGNYLKRYENKIKNDKYDDFLIEFVKLLYLEDKNKRPTASEALNFLDKLLSKTDPNKYMKMLKGENNDYNVNVIFKRKLSEPIDNNSNKISGKNNINNKIYNVLQNNNMPENETSNQFNRMNQIKNSIVNLNFDRENNEDNSPKQEKERYLTPKMSEENKIKSSMKCVLFILYKLEGMNMDIMKAKLLSILDNIKTDKSQYIIYSFCEILNTLQKFENKEINVDAYDKAVNNFIIRVLNNNNSGMSGTRPIILLYMLSHCIKEEFHKYFNNFSENNIYDNIIQNNFDIFNNLLPMDNQKYYEQISTKIFAFKEKFKGPFVDDFYFLMLLLSKCPQCGYVFGIKEFEVSQFLPLNVPEPENQLSDLVTKFFSPIPGEGKDECKKIGCPGKKKRLRQKFCLNLPNYLFLEFEDKNKIFFNEKISVPLFNGEIYYYEFYACIYKRKIKDFLTFSAVLKVGNAYYHYSMNKVECWNANNMNLENPSMALYKKIPS